ncbi:hypothetical protein VUR80DRAFT_7963 [Thermomyces stellatus]
MSMLGRLLSSRTWRVSVDPRTGESKAEGSPLVRRARAFGFSDKSPRGITRNSPEEFTARRKPAVKLPCRPSSREPISAGRDHAHLPRKRASATETGPGQLGPSGPSNIIGKDSQTTSPRGKPRSGVNYLFSSRTWRRSSERSEFLAGRGRL